MNKIFLIASYEFNSNSFHYNFIKIIIKRSLWIYQLVLIIFLLTIIILVWNNIIMSYKNLNNSKFTYIKYIIINYAIFNLIPNGILY